MKSFYFIGGPKKEFIEDFFQRLEKIGGTPLGWNIYPHANGDGKALHVVEEQSLNKVLEHLNHFSDIYDRSEIIEINRKR